MALRIFKECLSLCIQCEVKTGALLAPEKQLVMSVDVMKKKITEFPFESARRITDSEVSTATEAVKVQFGIKLPKRGRPAKDDNERYELVSIRLHPKVIRWARKEAEKRGVGYQTVINEALLEIAP